MSTISYGFWDVTERRYGPYSVHAEVVLIGVPHEEVLILPRRDLPRDPQRGETWRSVARLGAIVTNPEHLRHPSSLGRARDEDGFHRPEAGVFVRVDVTHEDGRIENRTYYRPEEIHAADALTGATSYFLAYAHENVREIIAYLDSSAGGRWPWPGSAVTALRSDAFAWVDSGIYDGFQATQDGRWTLGAAGPHERVFMGSGRIDETGASWLVYAIGQHLVVEFWRQGGFLTSRALDLGELTRHDTSDVSYVLGFGYDFEAGQVSLGVSMRGSGSGTVHRTWRVPELVGFGFEPDRLGIGGAPVQYHDGTVDARTAWGRVRPIRGEFTSETPLTRGFLATLSEGVPHGQ